MPIRRVHPDKMTTKQVANVLGVSLNTLYNMLRDGRIPEPPRDDKSGYRLWDSTLVQQIQLQLGELTPKRKEAEL